MIWLLMTITKLSKSIEYPTTHYDRGLIYKATGNIEKAISDFEKAADLYKEQGNQKWYQNSLDRLKELRNK